MDSPVPRTRAIAPPLTTPPARPRSKAVAPLSANSATTTQSPTEETTRRPRGRPRTPPRTMSPDLPEAAEYAAEDADVTLQAKSLLRDAALPLVVEFVRKRLEGRPLLVSAP